MATRVSISKCKVRGKPRWRVRWHHEGKVRRAFFTGLDKAELHAAKVRKDAIGAVRRLSTLPQADLEKLLLVYDEANKRGLDLLDLLSTARPGAVSLPIGKVIAEMEVAKRNAGRAGDYLSSLVGIASAFSKGRETLAIDQFTAKDVETYLDAKNIASRSTLRARLSTLFKFAVRRGYCPGNPCAALEAVKVAKLPPAVFTLDEVKTCLKWFGEHPRALAWFVLSTFAGLRPEEAQKTSWGEINFKEGWIKVEAQTTKVRLRRVVYPLPMVFAWLKRARDAGSELPLSTKSRVMELKDLRAVLEWPKWKQDVTRHTAASMWLALTGDAKTVAHQLGHSEDVLHRNYKAMTTKREAVAFYGLSAAQKAKTKNCI